MDDPFKVSRVRLEIALLIEASIVKLDIRFKVDGLLTKIRRRFS